MGRSRDTGRSRGRSRDTDRSRDTGRSRGLDVWVGLEVWVDQEVRVDLEELVSLEAAPVLSGDHLLLILAVHQVEALLVLMVHGGDKNHQAFAIATQRDLEIRLYCLY